MNNEIGRKITSLTLMTIMVAGGLTFAIPGVMPAAHAANANLFVSAENSQFDNYMSGPQVIEVVIIDSDINDTDQGKGEPDVTVNGKKLRMVQAVDGNWYGYFADRDQAVIADDTVNTVVNVGLDFGAVCSAASAGAIISADGLATDIDFTDTSGVFVRDTLAGTVTALSNPTAATISAIGDDFPTCTEGTDFTNTAPEINVVREVKAPNATAAANGSITNAEGQIGIQANSWPFIQLYTLNPTGNVVVQYNKGGGAQTTTLTFDTVDQFAGATLDRSVYPQSAQVHVTITDLWLNIDPTDEDSWTFGTISGHTTQGAYYQVFNENGAAAGAATNGGIIDIDANFGNMMIEKNGVLLINNDAQSSGTEVITLQDNGDTILTCSTADLNDATRCDIDTSASVTPAIADATFDNNGVTGNGAPITITEQGPNSGVFGTYDESDVSVIIMTSDALRGTSATIDYNETPATVLAGFDFGTVDIQPIDDEWSSGEEIPIVLVDGDANKNSRADEDLDLNNPAVDLIPTLKTGDPFTLGENLPASTTALPNGPTSALFYDSLASEVLPATAHTLTSQGIIDDWILDSELAGIGNAHSDSNILVQAFSERAIITPSTTSNVDSGFNALFIDLSSTLQDVQDSLGDTTDGATGELFGFNLLNLDVRSLSTTGTFDVFLVKGTIPDDLTAIVDSNTEAIKLVQDVAPQSLTQLQDQVLTNIFNSANTLTDDVGFLVLASAEYETAASSTSTDNEAIVIDIFSFGFTDDGVEANERVSNQIIRIEAEETGDNTSTFQGTLEYTMINQLNINTAATYTGLVPIADEATFIVIEDLTDEDAPRVNYNDRGADGVVTPIADQEEAPSHSGIVSLNANNYKVADTVEITLEDGDLNVNSDLIDIFTVVSLSNDEAFDAVGLPNLTDDLSFGDLGRMLDVTFDDERWLESNQGGDDNNTTGVTCGTTNVADGIDDGLGETGFTLVETGTATGIFKGDFQVPSEYCKRSGNSGTAGVSTTVTGTDIEVNYVDYRDASGEIIEVGDSAGVRANTGSISLDRTVYPVPWGVVADITGSDTGASTPNSRSVFPIHKTGLTGNITADATETLGNGDLTIHVRVNDPDADLNPAGQDTLATDVGTGTSAFGPVKISVSRGSNSVVLAYAGGAAATTDGLIDVGDNDTNIAANIRQMGPMTEIAPDAGIFELDFVIRYTDGPSSSTCPTTDIFTQLDTTVASTSDLSRFDATSSDPYCILQGDILTVQYTDPTDASGDTNTVTDSATFDLRNGVLQSDKSVYIIGSDMILTIIEPDWDLDNDAAETYDLDVIEWDSDAATATIGDQITVGASNESSNAAFDPEPSAFRETGDSTGIFQVVIEIPQALNSDNLERGEEIVLEYTDWGPSGSNYVGEEKEDVNLTVFTSNFGATVELDQKVYTWTDKVYITVVAPDHNFDSDLIDNVGNTSDDPVKVSTRGFNINTYKLVETGTDTGIFTGEVILIGFNHDADGKTTTGTATNGFDNPQSSTTTSTTAGPTDGILESDEDDGLTVSFEFSEDETVVGSALIRWNIGEVQWLEASYPASGTGVVRIIDADMNLNPESVDNFAADVWSDSDAGGIDLTVTETNEATGIFEGTVFFTTTDESSGHRLRVAEGDTVTAEYEDNTLPDPYTRADELDITATSLIGTVVPPLERAPAANLRTVDAFGNSLDSVTVDQQVQISADLANGQDREQTFAYLVQIQDGNGVTVSLAWITGSLSSGQSFSPALSWIPTDAGTYNVTAFVWESVDNPTALSPPVNTTVNVR